MLPEAECRFVAQFSLHFKQNVKWFDTELIKSGNLNNSLIDTYINNEGFKD